MRNASTIALVSVGSLLIARAASASVHANPDIKQKFDQCVAKFNAVGMGGLIDQINASGKDVTVANSTSCDLPHNDSYLDPTNESASRDGKTGSGSTVCWNADKNPPSVWQNQMGLTCAEDLCATLYHELAHANQAANGKDFTGTSCSSDYPIPTSEADATRAENAYRSAAGLCVRDMYTKLGTTYNLPPPLYPGGGGSVVCTEEPAPKPPGCGSCSVSAVGAGRSHADPHQMTYDGVAYDFHAVGEFILTRSTVDAYEVQTRNQNVFDADFESAVTAVAARVGSDRVAFYARSASDWWPTVKINGVATSVPAGGLALAGGGVIVQAYPSLVTYWADGSELRVRPLGGYGLSVTVVPAASRAGQLQGLLGNADGLPAGDLLVRNGSALPIPPAASDLYPTFADSWRITDATSLFDYGSGETTATFTNYSAPVGAPPSVTPAASAAAQAVCAAEGVTDAQLMSSCIYDVAATGIPSLASAAADVQAGLPTKVSLAGTTASIPFFGTASKRLFVNVPTTTFADRSGALLVRRPNGTLITPGGYFLSGSGFLDTLTLPDTGSYELVVDPGTSSGWANVRFYWPVDSSSTISINGPAVRAAVTVPGSAARLTFTAPAGLDLYADISGATLPAPDKCGEVRVVTPSGSDACSSGCISGGVGSACFNGSFHTSVAGTYTILFDPDGARIGQLSAHLHQ